MVDLKVLHVLNRIGFGMRPGEVESVQRMGIEAYMRSQLSPAASNTDPPAIAQQLSRLESLQLSPGELLTRYRKQPQQRQVAIQQAVQAKLLRAIASPHQLQEVMTDFWYNHFNIFSGKGLDRYWVGAYERQAIRPHVFGTFRTLLGATAQHPAMLFYLDNWQNTAPNSPGVRGRYQGINENYARELLELHTMGVDGGYTQSDILALAKVFTGWGFDRQGGTFYFNRDRHDFSDKVFLGQMIKSGGMAEGEQALDILARHPATARQISYKLAQYFVSDRPPDSLVNSLSQRFQATNGNIQEVLTTLFNSREFLDPNFYNTKFKTPFQYVVSAIRATETQINDGRAIFNVLRQLGMPPYGCISPDGYKNTQAAWLNPDAMLRRISFVTTLASGGFGNRTAPIDSQRITKALGNNFSSTTQQVLASSPESMRTALILGSPEFMRR